jgi:pyruvate dehydrogenase E1 component alpha subunit
MPGQRVDGNDVAAVLSVLGEAVERARAGGGPSLVEAHTYRMQAHTNADDDTRYRERDEVKAWVARDPLTRMRAYLTAQGLLDDAAEERLAAKAEEIAAALRDALNTDADLDPEDLFRFVTSERSPQLEEQWRLLRGEIERATADSTDLADAGGHR